MRVEVISSTSPLIDSRWQRFILPTFLSQTHSHMQVRDCKPTHLSTKPKTINNFSNNASLQPHSGHLEKHLKMKHVPANWLRTAASAIVSPLAMISFAQEAIGYGIGGICGDWGRDKWAAISVSISGLAAYDPVHLARAGSMEYSCAAYGAYCIRHLAFGWLSRGVRINARLAVCESVSSTFTRRNRKWRSAN